MWEEWDDLAEIFLIAKHVLTSKALQQLLAGTVTALSTLLVASSSGVVHMSSLWLRFPEIVFFPQ